MDKAALEKQKKERGEADEAGEMFDAMAAMLKDWKLTFEFKEDGSGMATMIGMSPEPMKEKATWKVKEEGEKITLRITVKDSLEEFTIIFDGDNRFSTKEPIDHETPIKPLVFNRVKEKTAKPSRSEQDRP